MSSAQEGCHSIGMLVPHAFVEHRAEDGKYQKRMLIECY